MANVLSILKTKRFSPSSNRAALFLYTANIGKCQSLGNATQCRDGPEDEERSSSHWICPLCGRFDHHPAVFGPKMRAIEHKPLW